MTEVTKEHVDALMQQISELQQTVKENAATPTVTIDRDQLEADFSEIMEGMIDVQVQQRMEQAPARRIPGEIVNANGDVTPLEALKGNKYFPVLRDFHRDGYSKNFGTKMKPIDLWFAHKMLEGQWQQKHSRIGNAGAAAPPSDDLERAVKALTSTGSGTGDELVPTDLAAQLWDDIFLASRVVNDGMVVIPMPTNPFDIPLGLGDVTWSKGSENTATTPSDPATAKSTLTATELITEQNWSYTLEEDAVVAMAPTIRSRLGISGAEIIDDFALNADSESGATGNVNLDDAAPAATAFYLSDGQNGIRRQWLVDNTAQGVNAGGDALADADFSAALVLMQKYAVDPEQVRCVVDISSYLGGFLKLTETVTVDKFGDGAMILTGQLAAYRGVPIIVSSSHRLAEADGKLSTTAGNNTLGSMSFFNSRMWYAGFRRQILIEVDRDIQKRQYIMVTSLREAVAAHGTRSSNIHTAGIRNILV
jgi:HK97 family phage major capsid protein